MHRGHAPGHVIFYNRAEGFAHLGDVLFAGSIGRTDLPGGDHQTLLDSIRDKGVSARRRDRLHLWSRPGQQDRR